MSAHHHRYIDWFLARFSDTPQADAEKTEETPAKTRSLGFLGPQGEVLAELTHSHRDHSATAEPGPAELPSEGLPPGSSAADPPPVALTIPPQRLAVAAKGDELRAQGLALPLSWPHEPQDRGIPWPDLERLACDQIKAEAVGVVAPRRHREERIEEIKGATK
jgi:hypothetical protein